ncbi:MAG TPA: sigma-70 family RNA polymerase sigma factor [Candidatus Limnocylindrales bacterium]|nr:sigma-70 family RNA polymerase sigma factor [Candidatus Limnocylindrales bacterium]
MAGIVETQASTGVGAAGELVTDAFSRHAAGLHRFLRSLTRDDALAEDLVQEAFLRLTSEIAAGRQPANPGAWLWRVGRNLATSHARHAAVESRSAWRLVGPDTDEAPEHAIVRAERDRAVGRAVACLPPAHRLAVLLAAEGYAGPEIAERLDRTPLATRALLCRVRGRLRVELAALGEP